MTTDYKVFRTEKKNGVFWIVMSNPKKRNAMGKDFWRELPLVFEEADKDQGTRAVVLAADGDVFSAGMDLMGMAMEVPELMSGEAGGRVKQKFLETIHRFQEFTSAPETCRKPVIAAIHGYCVGGGLDLIAACDIRLAAEDAKFNLKEAAVAMVADLGSLQRIAKIIGEGLVREMAFTAADIGVERAVRMHLINETYDTREALWEAAQQMGERIAGNSPAAIEITKEVLNWGRGRTVEEGLEYVAVRQIGLLPNPDLFEAVAAFGERRPPKFQD